MRSEVRTALRILTFQATQEELEQLGAHHLWLGLFLTWLVGIGRWWDDPGASFAMHLGLGSLAYVVVLTTLLYLLTRPLRPRNWRWTGVLTYVTLTSPPALLYALPVERWTDLTTATTITGWFLLIVAVWRVALWRRYLRRMAGLSWAATTVASAVPLMLIVALLTLLNLERAVFVLMRGYPPEMLGHDGKYTPHDGAYEVMITVTLISVIAIVPALFWYAFQLFEARERERAASASSREDASNE